MPHVQRGSIHDSNGFSRGEPQEPCPHERILRRTANRASSTQNARSQLMERSKISKKSLYYRTLLFRYQSNCGATVGGKLHRCRRLSLLLPWRLARSCCSHIGSVTSVDSFSRPSRP